MRLEYTFELASVDVPCFSVESVEGINKLFTLAALVLNVLSTRREVRLVFHGVNADDPGRKIESFKAILESAPSAPRLSLLAGQNGRVPQSATYYQWVTISAQ